MPLLSPVILLMSLVMSPVLTGDTLMVVDKSSHELVLYKHGEQIFKADVATGKSEELTPEGLFDVKVKAIEPYYRKKDIPGGDPKNPLGSRWIGFDAKETDGRTYGVHGTNNPSSIGKAVSAGCIRMSNSEVEKLYTLVEEDSEIIITKNSPNYEQIYEEWERTKWEKYLK
ncbi:L,D-transpeptidase [Halobacillus seohaensis]|uniref:L,D-transpeptidase n=1 Tax=Halobacillus seohaensis TaxID=447421 RepID=A0ABW2EIB5_9BACI